ncbi:MAG: TonB-dependent receptor [Saprospiraceae bacterium]|nr:TonB-dependent receptor [Saprospiraceae bacterium]
MKYLISGLILLISFLSSLAQGTSSISGKVVGIDHSAISYATIVLYRSVDNSLVKANFSELNGAFSFDKLEADTYQLKITYVGFKPFWSKTIEVVEGQDLTMESAILIEQAEELGEVVVKAARPLIEIQPDKTIFNVDGSINAAGSDALELLRKAPGVVVDNNERVLLQGKNGVKIYINGKKSPLSADDLADYLKSIQSNEIDAFEIITNPSARYEAEGNAGIINIRIKKDQGLGTNATVTSSFRQGTTAKANNNLSFNHHNKHLNLFGRYGNSLGQYRSYNLILREQVGQGFDTRANMVSDRTRHSYRIGTDLFLNEKSTLGFLVNGALSSGDWHNRSRTRIFPLTTGITSGYLIATNDMEQQRDNFNANANYFFEGVEGTSLSVDADFGLFRNNGSSYQPNTYLDASETSLMDERIFSSLTPTDIEVYTFKVDYEKSLWDGKWGVGGKLSYVTTDNTFDFFDVIDAEKIENIDRSNNFIYKENINAAYTTYNFQRGKFNFMAGIRMEHSHSLGDLNSAQSNNDELVERDYVDFFPSGGITFTPSDKSAWRLNYSRRIDRPNYQDLNPFEFKLDELTFQRGNAFLNPQYSNSFSLGHTYKQKLNTTLTYSVTTDLITEITDTFSREATFISKVNLAKQKNVSLAVSYPFSVNKWWSVYSNMTAYRVSNKANFGGTKIIDLSANVFTFYGQNTFLLPKGLKLEVSGFYNSPGLWGGNFRTDAMWAMDLGLQTRLFKDRANLKFALTDVFKTQDWSGANSFGALNVMVSGGWESRQFRATLTYNFGNTQVKKARSRQTGLEDEKRRVN